MIASHSNIQKMIELGAKVVTEKIVKISSDDGSEARLSKRDKFVELAEKRTVNAIKAIRIIGKLGNRNAYEYSEDDVKKIIRALNDEIDAMKRRMTNTGRSDSVNFKL